MGNRLKKIKDHFNFLKEAGQLDNVCVMINEDIEWLIDRLTKHRLVLIECQEQRDFLADHAFEHNNYLTYRGNKITRKDYQDILDAEFLSIFRDHEII